MFVFLVKLRRKHLHTIIDKCGSDAACCVLNRVHGFVGYEGGEFLYLFEVRFADKFYLFYQLHVSVFYLLDIGVLFF